MSTGKRATDGVQSAAVVDEALEHALREHELQIAGLLVAERSGAMRAESSSQIMAQSLAEQPARTGAVIETRIAGTGRDGGPACATVPLIGGWRIASSS